MLFGFDLNQLLVFPIQDNEARKHFLVGCLIYLAGFFIPILPWLVTLGYSAIIIRQVLNGEKPHMVPWDNWEQLFKDGARLFGISLVYSLPLFVLMIFFFLSFFAFPLLLGFMQSDNNQGLGIVWVIFILIGTGLSVLVVTLSLALGLIIPAAEIHAVAKDDFMSGFNVKEWWPIFRQNWVGFVVAMAILYALLTALTFAMQFMIFTVVLLCLLPLLMPVISMYYAIIQFAIFAQTYKEGKDKLSVAGSQAPITSATDL